MMMMMMMMMLAPGYYLLLLAFLLERDLLWVLLNFCSNYCPAVIAAAFATASVGLLLVVLFAASCFWL
eukprot:12424619-Karenia_brevis.AAC.1